ncbi:DUF790 family protein [Cerasicoccus maritimus]|uniref:DUF790 family protein n=1 Tax=Cerasicoccus maritimus TaxID=490089 RepID=UPI00285297C0|nr:DUF790 family protein [Cerasicoccus maritimus]
MARRFDRTGSRAKNKQYLPLAERMLNVYRTGIGLSRKELHRRIDALFDDVDNCPPKRVAAFQKLLDEGATYERGNKWTKLRQKVYALAAKSHPLIYESTESIFGKPQQEVKTAIAETLKLPWEDIEDNLFSDVLHFQRLSSFEGYASPEDLLARYNVAQTQGVLFDAIELELYVTRDLKQVIRQAKLARLMHTIDKTDSGYRILLDGPASVLRETRRYGSAMARFLPALLACQDWRLNAAIKLKNTAFNPRFTLTSDCRLRSTITPDEEFDSSIEASFAEKWGDQSRDGWQLMREERILHQDQKVFVPDFVCVHKSGKEVFFEIAGFWTESYWNRKLETLRTFKNIPIILAVPKSMAGKLPPSDLPVICYGKSIQLKAVLEALQSTRP